MKWIFTVVLLDAIYLAAIGKPSLADAVAGGFWGGLFTWWAAAHLSSPPGEAEHRTRWLSAAPALFVLIAVVLYDGLRNAFRALLDIRGTTARPGLVEVPVGSRSETGVAVTAWCTTLSPGSIFIGSDEERGVMIFHYVDAVDPERVRREHEQFYRRFQRSIVP